METRARTDAIVRLFSMFCRLSPLNIEWIPPSCGMGHTRKRYQRSKFLRGKYRAKKRVTTIKSSLDSSQNESSAPNGRANISTRNRRAKRRVHRRNKFDPSESDKFTPCASSGGVRFRFERIRGEISEQIFKPRDVFPHGRL